MNLKINKIRDFYECRIEIDKLSFESGLMDEKELQEFSLSLIDEVLSVSNDGTFRRIMNDWSREFAYSGFTITEDEEQL